MFSNGINGNSKHVPSCSYSKSASPSEPQHLSVLRYLYQVRGEVFLVWKFPWSNIFYWSFQQWNKLTSTHRFHSHLIYMASRTMCWAIWLIILALGGQWIANWNRDQAGMERRKSFPSQGNKNKDADRKKWQMPFQQKFRRIFNDFS